MWGKSALVLLLLVDSLWMWMGLGWMGARRMSLTRCRRGKQRTSMAKWGLANHGDVDANLQVLLHGDRNASVSEYESVDILRLAHHQFHLFLGDDDLSYMVATELPPVMQGSQSTSVEWSYAACGAWLTNDGDRKTMLACHRNCRISAGRQV